MNSWISYVNGVGEVLAPLTLSAFVQVAITVGTLLIVDWFLRDRVRAVLRHGLWLLVPIKLLLPPNAAVPTSVAYWFRPMDNAAEFRLASSEAGQVRMIPGPRRSDVMNPGGSEEGNEARQGNARAAALSLQGGWFLIWLSGTGLLLGYVGMRGWQVRQLVRRSSPAPRELQQEVRSAASELKLRGAPKLLLTHELEAPAVWGVMRPVVLMPSRLVGSLDPERMRSVFLHELAHVRRRDPWWNLLQAVLQAVYWWHPLVWWANARLRRTREEATDEMVVVAMEGRSADYASTLVSVARQAMGRPALRMGLLGIWESPATLTQRIHRLLDRPAPASGRLGWIQRMGVLLIAVALLPMAPRSAERNGGISLSDEAEFPEGVFAHEAEGDPYLEVAVLPRFYRAGAAAVAAELGEGVFQRPRSVDLGDEDELRRKLVRVSARENQDGEPFRFRQFAGGRFVWRVVPGSTNSVVNFQTRKVGDIQRVVGADIEVSASSEWKPMVWSVQPLRILDHPDMAADRLVCSVGYGGILEGSQRRQANLPLGDDLAIAWAERISGGEECQLVIMTGSGTPRASSGRDRAVGPNPRQEALQRELERAEAELEQLLRRYPEKWPAVIEQRQKVVALRMLLAHENRGPEDGSGIADSHGIVQVDAQVLEMAKGTRLALGIYEPVAPGGELDHDDGIQRGVFQANQLSLAQQALSQRRDTSRLAGSRISLAPGQAGSVEVSGLGSSNQAALVSFSMEVVPEMRRQSQAIELQLGGRLTDVVRQIRPPSNRQESSAILPEVRGVYAVNAIGYIQSAFTNRLRILDGQTMFLPLPAPAIEEGRERWLQLSAKRVEAVENPLESR